MRRVICAGVYRVAENRLVIAFDEGEVAPAGSYAFELDPPAGILEANAGGGVSYVQQLMGHSNVQTTLRYDRRPSEARKKTAMLLNVPFGG